MTTLWFRNDPNASSDIDTPDIAGRGAFARCHDAITSGKSSGTGAYLSFKRKTSR